MVTFVRLSSVRLFNQVVFQIRLSIFGSGRGFPFLQGGRHFLGPQAVVRRVGGRSLLSAGPRPSRRPSPRQARTCRISTQRKSSMCSRKDLTGPPYSEPSSSRSGPSCHHHPRLTTGARNRHGRVCSGRLGIRRPDIPRGRSDDRHDAHHGTGHVRDDPRVRSRGGRDRRDVILLVGGVEVVGVVGVLASRSPSFSGSSPDVFSDVRLVRLFRLAKRLAQHRPRQVRSDAPAGSGNVQAAPWPSGVLSGGSGAPSVSLGMV